MGRSSLPSGGVGGLNPPERDFRPCPGSGRDPTLGRTVPPPPDAPYARRNDAAMTSPSTVGIPPGRMTPSRAPAVAGTRPVRVVVVDDHDPVRAGLVELLSLE